MKITYNLKKDDVIEFNLAQMNQLQQVKTLAAVHIALPMLIIIIITIFLTYKGAIKMPSVAIIALLVIAWPFIYRRNFKRSLRRNLDRKIRANEEAFGIGEKELFVEDDQVISGTQELKFADMPRAESNASYFYFYIDNNSAIIIPKGDLTAEEEKLLEEKVNLVNGQ